jgi:hypothetical protein
MGWQFYRHMPVYLIGGRRLGRVEEVGHGVQWLHVQQGHIVVWDWYIPVSAIGGVTPDGVYLTVTKHDLFRNRWNVPSEAYLQQQGLVVGYDYTGPADVPSFAAGHGDQTISAP